MVFLCQKLQIENIALIMTSRTPYDTYPGVVINRVKLDVVGALGSEESKHTDRKNCALLYRSSLNNSSKLGALEYSKTFQKRKFPLIWSLTKHKEFFLEINLPRAFFYIFCFCCTFGEDTVLCPPSKHATGQVEVWTWFVTIFR